MCVVLCVYKYKWSKFSPWTIHCIFTSLSCDILEQYRDGSCPLPLGRAMAQTVTGFLPQMPVFITRLVFVGFMVEKLALGQFLTIIPLCSIFIISFIYHQHYVVLVVDTAT